MWARRLSPERQVELLAAYDRGERVVDIAARFGVHHTYPSLLARRRQRPTRLNRVNAKFKENEND